MHHSIMAARADTGAHGRRRAAEGLSRVNRGPQSKKCRRAHVTRCSPMSTSGLRLGVYAEIRVLDVARAAQEIRRVGLVDRSHFHLHCSVPARVGIEDAPAQALPATATQNLIITGIWPQQMGSAYAYVYVKTQQLKHARPT